MVFKKGPITTPAKRHGCVVCTRNTASGKRRDPLDRIKGHPWMCAQCYSNRCERAND